MKMAVKYESPVSFSLDEEIQWSILTTSGDDLPDWTEEEVNGNDDF